MFTNPLLYFKLTCLIVESKFRLKFDLFVEQKNNKKHFFFPKLRLSSSKMTQFISGPIFKLWLFLCFSTIQKNENEQKFQIETIS